ncbi:hypothetical protein BDV28DRAFT_157044 [Aspergillus coremiiformis]|uniref:Restriction endonuclease domain-containing protein n=1 Tax=Aspergillus coremiiformis TaxID=138285 RepID=A0A5N6Z983_9EURO|nr:hypothetical protein BDV28DRAFT_157044 [Aspergillus coremiiformis]
MPVDTTLPNRFMHSPSTSPPTGKASLSSVVSRIINIKMYSRRCRQDAWTEYSLSLDEYDELRRQVGRTSDLFEYDKIRYDYEPLKSRFTVRMPTPLHEILCAKAVEEITLQRESVVRQRGKAADFAKDITCFASSRIDLPYDSNDASTLYIRREPDASFGHLNARYPGVVIEICHSQKARRIPALAEDYILNSDGSVNAVVFFDIEYPGKEASFSIWRPCFEVFRKTDGLAAESMPLTLKLKDFATEHETRGYSDLNQDITISARDLCCYLDCAESRQQAQERHEGSVQTMPMGTRKRRRAETPPDKINSDEAVFQALEESDGISFYAPLVHAPGV